MCNIFKHYFGIRRANYKIMYLFSQINVLLPNGNFLIVCSMLFQQDTDQIWVVDVKPVVNSETVMPVPEISSSTPNPSPAVARSQPTISPIVARSQPLTSPVVASSSQLNSSSPVATQASTFCDFMPPDKFTTVLVSVR